jgi:hypothetical protein
LWWIWVWLIPLWVVTYVTMVKDFDFNDLCNACMDFFNLLLADTQKAIIIGAAVVGLIILYVMRDHILAMIGLDDRNIVHYLNLQGGDSRLKPFQVCVWRVCASQKSEFKTAHIMDDYGNTRNYTFPQLFNREENVLPNQGSQCNLFVRLAFGDNEPQTSRIVRMDRVMRQNTIVPFRETFSLELLDDPELDNALHVEVRDQALVGAQELGRVTLKIDDIKDAIEAAHNEVAENARHKRGFTVMSSSAWAERRAAGGMFGSVNTEPDLDQAEKLDAAEEQVLWLLSKEVQNAGQEKAKQLMEQVGFKPYRLSKGGTIWLAFSWLDVEVR